MLQVVWTVKFKKEYKLCMKRGKKMDLLDDVIRMLAAQQPLPAKYRDHVLSNNWEGFRECHIEPDWLLIYGVSNERLILTLVRTGSHSDLF